MGFPEKHLCLARHQDECAEHLYTIIDNVMSPEWCSAIAERVTSHITSGNVGLQKPPIHEGEERFVPGPYCFHMIVGGQVRKSFPELDALYRGWCSWLSLITKSEIIISPHKNLTTGEPSDVFWVNIKAYQAGNGELDWHQDRNPWACILYLNNCDEGALHVRRDRNDPNTERRILPKCGRLVLINGQTLWHAAKSPRNIMRIAAVMSYFTPNNTTLVDWTAAKERGILNAS